MFLRTLTSRAGWATNTAGHRGLSIAQQAKVMSSSFGVRPLATKAKDIKELPGDPAHDVVFESKYGLRSITLNRPKKLNSLDASMIRKIVPRMFEWERSDMANVVVLKGAGGKALCAGGDVVALAKENQASEDGWKNSAEYFALEYKLDHYIATYQKPYVAFMDGITMGGGVGLSIHAPFRIATEKTVFAMPETTIGFFPDVGASFFLPRMNGAVGTYLALTSNRLTGPNVFYSGIATHYLHSSSLPDLEARLSELRFRDEDTLAQRLQLINLTLEEFSTGLPYDQPMQLSGDVRQAIDRCFSKDNVADIIAALEAEEGSTAGWAKKQLETLQSRSPTAVHVTLRQMRVSKDWDIAETFQREHQIATHFMKHPDFSEGVLSRLVTKSAPKWQPESLAAIPASEDVSKPFFEYDEENKLKLFTDRTYKDYPFPELNLPSEKEVEELIKATSTEGLTPKQLLKKVVESRQGRQGVAEVVKEMMERKIDVDENGKVQWVTDDLPSLSKL